MAYYRLYFMDAYSGHIEKVREIDADDDAAAIALAEESRALCPMELWRGRNRIKRWESVPPIDPT